jgi:hypothetical protein
VLFNHVGGEASTFLPESLERTQEKRVRAVAADVEMWSTMSMPTQVIIDFVVVGTYDWHDTLKCIACKCFAMRKPTRLVISH